MRDALYAAFAAYGHLVGARDAVLVVGTTEHDCFALIESTTNAAQQGTATARVRDAVIAIFGASLPDGVVPKVGDKIRLEDTDGAVRTFHVRGEAIPGGGTTQVGVAGDPVGAMYRCPCRG